MFARQLGDRCTARHLAQLPHQRTDAPPELNRPPGLITVPERHLPRLTRSGAHQHTVVRNLIDTPRRCAQHNRLTSTRLDAHLLVEFAYANRLRMRPA